MIYQPIKSFMRMAIDDALVNFKMPTGGPFGACIVKNNDILAVSRNTVLAEDATCHAEINAIRTASRMLGTFNLENCVIYSTTEPCPMCFGAIHWARISTIIYGTSIEDALNAGFNELTVFTQTMKQLGNSSVEIIENFMRDECMELFTEWIKTKNNITY